MFHERVQLFIFGKICLIENWITWSQKELAKPQSQIPNIQYILEKETINARDSRPYADSWMAASTAVLYYSTEYHNSRQNIIVLFCKYLVDIRSSAWLIIFWKYLKGKLFKLQFLGRTLYVTSYLYNKHTWDKSDKQDESIIVWKKKEIK